MAFVRPPLVVDTTGTSGTGTYTLDDPAAPGDGFRTLADAVADGDVSAGDTISYFVVDTTTTAAALAWEHGTGTVGAGGLSLARTTVLSSSNGGLAVSWGSGGSRTVRFGAGTAGFALLAAAQTWTAVQTFAEGLAATKNANAALDGLTVTNVNTGASASAFVRTASDTTTAQFISHGSGRTGTSRFGTTLAGISELLLISGNGLTIGNLGAVPIRFGVGGNLVAQITGAGAFVNAAGAAFATEGVLNAPSGGVILWGSTSLPAGWTLITANVNDRSVLLTDTLAQAGGLGGSWTVSGITVDEHFLTAAEMPAHTHAHPNSSSPGLMAELGSGTGGWEATAGGTRAIVTSATTTSTGGDGGHDHTLTADGAWRPLYRKFVAIQKS